MDSSVNGTIVYLAWRTHGWIGAVPARHVTEIMRPLPIEPLIGAPVAISGLSVVRGKATPILDIGLLISRNRGSPSRVVIVTLDEHRDEPRWVGLAVDEVLGIRTLDASRFRGLPPLLHECEDAGISRMAVLDGALMFVLEVARIVPESIWAEVDGRRR